MKDPIEIAVLAVKRIIVNLYDSDFRDMCGYNTINSLEVYKYDMAADVYQEITGEVPTAKIRDDIIFNRLWDI